MLMGFLSVASWKEYNRSTSNSERMPLREKLTAGFSSFLLQTQKGWGDVLAGEKENPSVWYVCPYESGFGSRGQVLALRNSIRALLSSVLKVPPGGSQWNGGSPAAGTGCDGLLATAVGETGLCFKGNVSSPDRQGSDRGWERWELGGAHSNVVFFLWKLLSLARSSACLWLLLRFPSPLWLQTLHVTADRFATLLGNAALCRRSAPRVSEPRCSSGRSWEMSLDLGIAAGGVCQSPYPPASPPIRDGWAN